MDVRRDLPLFEQAGGSVAVVTMGSPAQANAFRQRLSLPFPVLADPDRRAYQAFRLDLGGVAQIAGPRTWLPGIKALFRGGAGKPVGDVRQMPGAFVIDTAGIVRYAHYARHSADYPEHKKMIKAFAEERSEERGRKRAKSTESREEE